MKADTNKRSISGLAALIVLALFAAVILSVLLSGAGIYRRLTERDSVSYNARTCAQYIATKVRQAPSPDSISVTGFGDGDALVISQNIDGEKYLTRVYCHDGWLMELFTVSEGDFYPEDGQKVFRASELSLSFENGHLLVETADENSGAIRFRIFPRGREGAVT